jgi:hypothetical protein
LAWQDDEEALQELHVDGVVGAAYPAQLPDEGTHVGGGVPAPESVVPDPGPDDGGAAPPGHVLVGTQTLTCTPLDDVSMLHAVPEGHVLSPSLVAQDEAQKLSP